MSFHEELYEEIAHLCTTARSKIIFAAPFIKIRTLRDFFELVDPGVDITVVTRWLVDDIISGVCDLEIWDLVEARPQTRLMINQKLHAKYYRSEGDCLVGSANLTGRGLGTHGSANLELLVPVMPSALIDFEMTLLHGSIDATPALVNELRAVLDGFDQTPREDVASPSLDLSDDGWFPSYRAPFDLWDIYVNLDSVETDSAADVARKDLVSMRIPPALNLDQFRAAVGYQLQILPWMPELNSFLATTRRFGEVANELKLITGHEVGKNEWQTLMRWLLAFCPENYVYRRPGYTEILEYVG